LYAAACFAGSAINLTALLSTNFRDRTLGIVYPIPVLGGAPRKIIEDVDTPITFSPDGKRFAFIRQYTRMGETALFIANSNGAGEQKIASRHRPKRFTAGTPIWLIVDVKS
ncbi:MAG: hypothetical protein ABR501_14280, partial [Pyrinomonadaceae bacterium]